MGLTQLLKTAVRSIQSETQTGMREADCGSSIFLKSCRFFFLFYSPKRSVLTPSDQRSIKESLKSVGWLTSWLSFCQLGYNECWLVRFISWDSSDPIVK